MTSDSIPMELVKAREEIDLIDREIVTLLAQRFELTHKVGKLKADQSLDALDARRESEKLAEIKALCEQHNLNSHLVTELFTRIMEEVVRNHNRLREPTR
jgi:chorismate mutase